jgi:hypothetical protein
MPNINTSELDSAIEALGTSVSNILQTALSAEDFRLKSLVTIDFQDDAGPYGKGLRWLGEGIGAQFIYRANPDRIWTSESIDLAENASIMIGNSVMLSRTELGSTVRNSNLTRVGTLNNLRTQGNLVIDDYIYYNTDQEALGIGTESPNGKFAVATLDSEFIIDTAPGLARAGTWTSDDLHLVTDNTTQVVIRANGNIELGNGSASVKVSGKLGVGVNQVGDVSLAVAGPIRMDGKKMESGTAAPQSGTYKEGDIVWNSNPAPSGYVGWVCISSGTPGEWKPFGRIST